MRFNPFSSGSDKPQLKGSSQKEAENVESGKVKPLTSGHRQRDLDELMLKLAVLEKECLQVEIQGNKVDKNDPFLTMKSTISEQAKKLFQLVNQRNEIRTNHGNTVRVIQLNLEIKQELSVLNEQFQFLKRFFKTASEERKAEYTEEELDNRFIVLQAIKDDIESLKIFALSDASDPSTQHIKTLNQFLESHNNQRNSDNNDASTKRWTELSEKEKAVLDQWKDHNLKIDRQVDEIGEIVDRLTQAAIDIGNKTKLQSERVAELEDRADKVGESLFSVNESVQRIMKNQGGMNLAFKLCLVFILVLLLSYIIPTLRQRLFR